MSKTKDSIIDRLQLIKDSALQIQHYTIGISCPNDFLTSPGGMLRLDACIMRLQVIGETVRSLLSLENCPLESHPEIPWHQIVGLRNIISHEYMSVDEVLIYDAAKNDLEGLLAAINDILSKLH